MNPFPIFLIWKLIINEKIWNNIINIILKIEKKTDLIYIFTFEINPFFVLWSKVAHKILKYQKIYFIQTIRTTVMNNAFQSFPLLRKAITNDDYNMYYIEQNSRLCTFNDTANKIVVFRIYICGPICLRHCGSQEAQLFSIELQKWL